VIIIGINSNMCNLDISGLSDVDDGHKALICFRCLHIVWNQMDNLLVNKEKTHRKQTYELHPNTSNSHVDIISTEM
jgi:hypothetical protein